MIINTGLRTDIPGFFSQWFYKRVEEEYVYVRNPYFKKQVFSYNLNPNIVDCLIFCTKNPKPMLSKIDKINDFNQFWFVTITPYGKEIEPNVPSVKKVLKSFKELSNTVGKENISLRYDPIFIHEKYTLEEHIESFEKITNSLSEYTTEIIISFIDLYEKTKYNFPTVKEVREDERLILGKEFVKITNENNIKLKTCVEGKELAKFGIDSTGCMTKNVIERATKGRLDIKVNKVRNGQCDCLLNNDIGAYNSCNHGCIYCYANSNKKLVKRNFEKHNPKSPILIGEINDNDKIKKINQKSNLIKEKTIQTKLF